MNNDSSSPDPSLEVLVPVDVPILGDERRKNWAKIVNNVDDQKASGWAFEGDFISVGGIQDIPVGSVVLIYGERGSRTNPQSMAAVYVTNSDATLTKHHESSGRAWARTLRDSVQELLSDRPQAHATLAWRPELILYSEEALIHELRRRGVDLGGAPT